MLPFTYVVSELVCHDVSCYLQPGLLQVKAAIASIPGHKCTQRLLCSTMHDRMAATWLGNIGGARYRFKSACEGSGNLRLAAIDLAHQPAARKQSAAVGAALQQQPTVAALDSELTPEAATMKLTAAEVE